MQAQAQQAGCEGRVLHVVDLTEDSSIRFRRFWAGCRLESLGMHGSEAC